MSRRILLVEDEPGLVLTLTDRLMAEGYDVESEGDAVKGLARGSAGSFDVILLDVMLPGGGGFDVCRTLRQRGVQTPIMMLTARGQEQGRDELQKKVDALTREVEALKRQTKRTDDKSLGSWLTIGGDYRFRIDSLRGDVPQYWQFMGPTAPRR